VRFLHRREVGIDRGHPGIRLGGRHRPVFGGAVDFVLPVLEVPRRRVTVIRHVPVSVAAARRLSTRTRLLRMAPDAVVISSASRAETLAVPPAGVPRRISTAPIEIPDRHNGRDSVTLRQFAFVRRAPRAGH
jgi:hypothetical protein